jgi:RNA polymerase sigma factor (sigma-70 family)
MGMGLSRERTTGSKMTTVPPEPWPPRWYHSFDRVYDAFHASLRRGARRLISRRLRRRVAEDDVVQSVFRTFYRRHARGECEFDHTGALRNYLWKILGNKVRRYAQRHHAQLRDVMAEVEPGDSGWMVELPDGRPGPEAVVILRDEISYLTRGFLARDLRILNLHFAAYSSEEIAQRVGCSRWTVRRVVEGFGRRLQDASRAPRTR